MIPVEELTRQHIIDALNKCDWRILTTSKYLGVSRDKLWRILNSFNIKVETKLGVRNKYKYNSDKVNNMYHKMIARCYNPERSDYNCYGARGISVCEEWRNNKDSFYEYITSLENFGLEGYTMDRINNDGNYEPGNIQFVDKKAQANNTRRNRMVEYNGEVLTMMQFYEKYGKYVGLSYSQLHDRLKLGFTPEEVLSLPKNKKRKYYFKEQSND